MFDDDDYKCETCNREFASQHAAVQHMDAVGHWAPRFQCETCDREFLSQYAVNQHMNVLEHWEPRYECETCTSRFYSQSAADQHMRALGHWLNYCRDCDRVFQNENNLKMHLNSRIHRGTQIPCPFCNTTFTTASGVSHHLESASCPKAANLNRETIYREVKSRDPHGLVTQKLLTYPDVSPQAIATDATWNGEGFECYLCRRDFASLRSLNQHLNSPAHEQKIYHCPNRHCGRQAVSLAALFNHLESESCGYIRFEKVQQSVGGFLTGRQRLIRFS